LTFAASRISVPSLDVNGYQLNPSDDGYTLWYDYFAILLP